MLDRIFLKAGMSLLQNPFSRAHRIAVRVARSSAAVFFSNQDGNIKYFLDVTDRHTAACHILQHVEHGLRYDQLMALPTYPQMYLTYF